MEEEVIMDSIVLAVLVRTMVAGTPLLLGTVGEVLTERSGILNFGIEGMMSLGAVSAFMVTLNTGNPWLGLLAAVLAGTLGGLLHAVVTVSLQSTQVVSGLALTMLGLGVSGFLGKPFIGIPLEVRMTPVAIPLLSRIPALGDILFNQSPIFYLFSFEHVHFVEFEGEKAGMILGYDWKIKKLENLRTGFLLLKKIGVGILKKLSLFIRFNASGGKLHSGEFYISNIAVEPKYRGMGVGKRIMLKLNTKRKWLVLKG